MKLSKSELKELQRRKDKVERKRIEKWNEVKKKMREYYQRPEVKKKMREYYQRPEVKKKMREYYEKKKRERMRERVKK